MSDTREMLTKNMLGVRESIEEYVRQIESGGYGNKWQVQSFDEPVDYNTEVIAHDEHGAIEAALTEWGLSDSDVEYSDFEAEQIAADEPTISDTYGNNSPISEYPLEVVDERGKEFAVVLSTGGPHIEVVADGGNSARLAGYWGGEQVYMHGDVFDTFLDYFIERD